MSGKDALLTAQLLGHADLATVSRYIAVDRSSAGPVADQLAQLIAL